MIWIPVSGTVFTVLMILGGIAWAVHLSSGGSKAVKRAQARKARAAVHREPGRPPPLPYNMRPPGEDQPG